MKTHPALRASLLRACIRFALATPPALFVCLDVGATETDTAPPSASSAPTTEGDLKDTATPDPTTLDRVSVTGASYDPRRDDTASRIVVGHDELVKFGDGTLSDALKRLPGVTVGTGAPGRSGAVALRGLGNGYTQILVDGQAAPTGFDLGSLSPGMVERVEIIRSATADMRTEAIAGSINIVLAKVARSDSRELKFGAGVANGQLTPSVSWSQSRRDDDLSHTFSGTLARREFLVEETAVERGFDPSAEPNLLRNSTLRVEGARDALSLAPNFSKTLGNGDRLSLRSFLEISQYQKAGDIGWSTQLGPQLRHARYDQSLFIDVVQLRTDLGWNRDFDHAGRLETKFTLGGNHEDFRFREQGFAPDGTQNLDDVTTAELQVKGYASAGKYVLPSLGDHTIETGWEGSIDRRIESRLQRLRAVAGLPESISDLSFDARIRRLAFYAQDDWAVTPDWSLYLGMRWEQIETTSEGNQFESIRHRARVFSPVMQSLWRLPGTKGDQLRLGFSRTFRSPPIRQLIPRPYTATNNRALDPDQQGNPALRAEVALGLDVAYERHFDDGALISLGGYVREIADAIRSETRLIDGRWVASPINGGNATTWGIEIDSKFPLMQLIADAPDIEIAFNLTRNWSTVDDVPGPDNRIGQQPRLSATVSADYTINPAWSAGASFSYRSGGEVRTTPMQIESGSALRQLDLYALRRLSAWSRLRLSAGNLLQQDIVTGTQYFDEQGSLQQARRRDAQLVLRAEVEIRF